MGPDGDVTPCPFASDVVVGNVRTGDSLADIVSSGALTASVPTGRRGGDDDDGDDEDPDEECTPGFPGSSCTPRN